MDSYKAVRNLAEAANSVTNKGLQEMMGAGGMGAGGMSAVPKGTMTPDRGHGFGDPIPPRSGQQDLAPIGPNDPSWGDRNPYEPEQGKPFDSPVQMQRWEEWQERYKELYPGPWPGKPRWV